MTAPAAVFVSGRIRASRDLRYAWRLLGERAATPPLERIASASTRSEPVASAYTRSDRLPDIAPIGTARSCRTPDGQAGHPPGPPPSVGVRWLASGPRPTPLGAAHEDVGLVGWWRAPPPSTSARPRGTRTPRLRQDELDRQDSHEILSILSRSLAPHVDERTALWPPGASRAAPSRSIAVMARLLAATSMACGPGRSRPLRGTRSSARACPADR